MFVGSRYNVTVPRADGLGAVIYNTLTGGLTQCSQAEEADVRAALVDPRGAQADIVSTLAAQGHLVDEGTDELEIARARKSAGISDSNRLDVVIMPTLDCNFRCTYCYEEHRPDILDDADTAAIMAWLDREVPTTKFVLLHWFGGEPLLHWRRVVEVTEHLSEVSRRSQVATSVHITTNGYLLTGERLDRLLAAGIRDFQVTMDGPARTHDRSRPLAGGRPSFDRILGNVHEAVRADAGVRITIRVNFNHENIADLQELIDSFDPAITGQLRLVLEPVFGDESVSAVANLTGDSIAQFMNETYSAAEARGFDVAASRSNLVPGKLVYCYAERDKQVIIGPGASVYKCAVGDFDQSQRLARIDPSGRLVDHAGRLGRWAEVGDSFAPTCAECVYLPLCMGGCRKTRMLDEETGDFCALVPANAGYVLKQIALVGIDATVLGSVGQTLEGGDHIGGDPRCATAD